MALSEYYNDVELYLTDAFQFLKDFQWIYTTSNTEFMVAETLNQIPFDWIPTIDSLTLEEMNQIPFDYINKSWPITLQKFLFRLKRLKPMIDEPIISIQDRECEQEFFKGIKSKKVYEIYELSNEILRNCGSSIDTNVLIDLGCGIGHLTNFLHMKYHYKILGIEADLERFETAKKLQLSKFPESMKSVKFVHHFIETSSVQFITSVLSKELNMNQSTELVLTGLHACADLSVTALKLFFSIPNVIRMLIMPCCYHKMKLKSNSSNEFENVPLSERVNSVQYAKDIINRPFLRLAGQQTAVRWRNITQAEHTVHGRNMFIRGVVQAVLSEDEIVVKNKKAIGQVANELDQYKLFDKYKKSEKIWSNSQKLAFINLLTKYPNGGHLSEFLTCLQASIQSVCENVILLDRILYTKEEAVKMNVDLKIGVKKIVMDAVSPRCFVVIAEKNK